MRMLTSEPSLLRVSGEDGPARSTRPHGGDHPRTALGGTVGGARLRSLRERIGRPQLWVEAEAELGCGYLQRVESGRVAQPSRTTVERILGVLGARYSEQREILELFGYAVSTPLPTEHDHAWAREACRRELHEFPFPAYVLDCAHRLVAWNGTFPRLLGLRVIADHPILRRLAGCSLLAAFFDPASPLSRLVAEPERLLPALIRALRYEMQQFGGESWYPAVLAELLALPRFRRYWTEVDDEPPAATAARSLVPLRLVIPGSVVSGGATATAADTAILEFRLASERFTRDARFRIIYYFPADPATTQVCAAWVAARGCAGESE